jgi:hypothetical protein
MTPDQKYPSYGLEPNSVLRKTRKGYSEVANQESFLHPKLRRLLILIDGASTVAEIVERMGAIGDVKPMVTELFFQGFITGSNSEFDQTVPPGGALRPVQQAAVPIRAEVNNPWQNTAPINAAANAQAGMQFNNQQQAPVANPNAQLNNILMIKSALIDDMQARLGKDAERVVPKIQACQSPGDLLMLIVKLRDFLVAYSGKEQADAFLARFQKLLG